MNQQIISYLQQNKAAYSKEVLVQQLRNVGYGDSDIQEAVNIVYETENPPHSASMVNILKPELSLNKKQLRSYVLEQLNSGKLKPELENNLSSTGYAYESYNNIMSIYPELHMKLKYATLNKTLVFFIAWFMFSNILNILGLDLAIFKFETLLLLSFVTTTFLAIFMAYVIKRDRRAYIYLACILFFGILRSGDAYWVALFPKLAIIGLCVFLAIKMYPEYSFITGRKKKNIF